MFAGGNINHVSSPQFMAELRAKKTHQAAEFKLEYVSLTPDACDVVRLTNIKGMPDAVLEPTICIGAKLLPRVKVIVKENGMTVPVTFKAK